MDARAIDRYIGIPYCAQTMDCADLAVLLQAELFGRAINLPGRRQRLFLADARRRRGAGSLALSSGSCGRPKMSLHIAAADSSSPQRTAHTRMQRTTACT